MASAGVIKIPLDLAIKVAETIFLLTISKDNCYPKTFLHNCCKPVTSFRDTSVDEVPTASFAAVPYIGGVTEDKNLSSQRSCPKTLFSDTGAYFP